MEHASTSKDLPTTLRFDLNPEEILAKTKELVAHAKAVEDAVAAVAPENRSFETILKPLAELYRVLDTDANSFTFPAHVSTSKPIRDASTEADKLISAYGVESGMRHDVYTALIEYESKGEKLEGEAKRFLERQIRSYKRNGLHLPADDRKKLEEIQKRMSELSIQYSKNSGEENTTLTFTKSELEGMNDDFLSGLKTESDPDNKDNIKYVVSLKYPEYFPVMRNCAVEETRRKLEFAFNTRNIKENTKILEELVELRDQRAKMLGFATHADYILEIRMAKSPKNVSEFLVDLAARLDVLADTERQEILQLKKEEKEKRGEPFDGKINHWDNSYYLRRREEKLYKVNQQELKKYFPLQVVTTGLLDIYQNLLGLVFTEIKDAHVWHPDVKMFSVKDQKEGFLLGHFYLDLHPREGKYGHAACFGLQPGCLKNDGTRQYPAAAMVANFSKPTEGKDATLEHDEVETFFHEFGHVMHQVCSITDFAYFSGTAVERDFVEAPSQMLENWVWKKESLQKMSAHEVDKTPIPDELLNSLIASKVANAGLFNLRQILLATLDQTIHTQPKADTAKILSELCDRIIKLPMTPGTNMAASFGHLAGGYDAQYYGYLWSEVFSADMFESVFEKEGILSQEAGMRYRKFILQPGGSRDANDMLKDFLGREPTKDAFLRSKGLTV